MPYQCINIHVYVYEHVSKNSHQNLCMHSRRAFGKYVLGYGCLCIFGVIDLRTSHLSVGSQKDTKDKSVIEQDFSTNKLELDFKGS